MEAIPYKSKSGRQQFRPLMNEDEYFSSDSAGFCLACGAEVSGVEPDARQYECDNCGEKKVYGLEELLMMGLLKFGED